MKRLLMLVVAVIAAIAAWLTPPAVPPVVSAPATAGVTYNYDRHPHTEPRTYATTERGPPTTAATVTTYNAVDVQAHRLSARPDVIAPQPIFGYDHPSPPVQVVGAASTTAAGASLDSAQFARSSVAAEDAAGFVGRKGVTKVFDDGSSASYGGEIRIPRGTNAPGEVGGRQYSGHAFDQMQGRGITPSVVDDAIANGVNLGGDGASIFYGQANNISVVVSSEGRVITVGYGMFKPR